MYRSFRPTRDFVTVDTGHRRRSKLFGFLGRGSRPGLRLARWKVGTILIRTTGPSPPFFVRIKIVRTVHCLRRRRGRELNDNGIETHSSWFRDSRAGLCRDVGAADTRRTGCDRLEVDARDTAVGWRRSGCSVSARGTHAHRRWRKRSDWAGWATDAGCASMGPRFSVAHGTRHRRNDGSDRELDRVWAG